MKSKLIENVAVFLLKEGFTVKNLTGSCFDLLARESDKILLIKVLEDANAITKQHSGEMNIVAAYVSASPIILAEKGGDKLEDNVLYTRFNIYTLNFHTFMNAIKKKFPFVKRSQAGLTVSINAAKLKQKRQEFRLSLQSLSNKVGVTGRMITKYEQEGAEITLQKAMKLYNIFGNQVFTQINIFSKQNEIESTPTSHISRKYNALGFHASDTKKTPFDIIARKDSELILTEIGDKKRQESSALSRLLDADALVIFDKKKPKNVAAITKKEFLAFDRAKNLIKFLKEFD